jgi:hypothetical protein
MDNNLSKWHLHYTSNLSQCKKSIANESEYRIRGVELDNSVPLQQDAVSVGGNLNVLAFPAML